MRYRIDDLAASSGVSVSAIRYYQSQGLLPRPVREGRIAWYGEQHLERLQRIRAGKRKGLPLATIRRLLDDATHPPAGGAALTAASGHADGGRRDDTVAGPRWDLADAALAAELAGPVPGEDADALLTLEELSERSGLPMALLEALERDGLLVPRTSGGRGRYTASDADVLRSALSLLQAGVPLDEFLDLARRHDRAMRDIAGHAVELFVRFVRDPIAGSAASEQEASERLVTALREMLPATGAIVDHHFRRLLVNAAQARIERDGDEAELAALRRVQARWTETPSTEAAG